MSQNQYRLVVRVRICGGDHKILAKERSVGPEAERGEIDSKMGRRVCFDRMFYGFWTSPYFWQRVLRLRCLASQNFYKLGVRVSICCGDHMILAREKSVGPEAERGEIDSKMGRRVSCVRMFYRFWTSP